MGSKVRVELFSGPKDGYYFFADDIEDHYLYFDYSTMLRPDFVDFSQNEYHVYKIDKKTDTGIVYIYNGVSPIQPQD